MEQVPFTKETIDAAVGLLIEQREHCRAGHVKSLFPRQGSIFSSMAKDGKGPPFLLSPVGALAIAVCAKDHADLGWGTDFMLGEYFEEADKNPHVVSHISRIFFGRSGLSPQELQHIIERDARFSALPTQEEAFDDACKFLRSLGPPRLEEDD